MHDSHPFPQQRPMPAGARPLPTYGAPVMQPAVYWGAQPPRLVGASSGAEAPAGDIVDVAIDTTDGAKVDGANVVITDIGASNGIIHVIDHVIMPN